MATPSRFMRPPTRPVGQGWDDPPSSVDARPVNVAYDPQTGPGTGSPSRRMGTMGRNGIVRPVTAMGSATGPLTTPNRSMTRGPVVDPVKLSEAKARAALKFNQENPGLHKDEVTGFTTVHTDAENRIAKAAAANAAADSSAAKGSSGAFMKPKPMPMQSTYGQASSMQRSMAPNPGEDRYGRTSASPSAFGAPRQMPAGYNPAATPTNSGWQQGVPGTTSMSGPYGGGTVNNPNSASNVAKVASAVNNASGTMGKFSAGIQAAAQNAAASPSTLASKTPSNATFDGKTRDQFFGDAAKRQGTSNMFANRPMPGSSTANTANTSPAAPATTAPTATPPPASTAAAPAPKMNPDGSLPPSSLAPPVQQQFPAGSLEQRAQSLGNAATNSANFAGAQAISNSSGAGNLAKQPSPFFAQKPMPTAPTPTPTPTPTPATSSAPVAGSGFTGPAGEAAAKQAIQQSKADDAAALAKANDSMNTLGKFSPSTFRPTTVANNADTTSDRNAARGFNDTADLARYKAEDAGNQANNAPTVQVTDEQIAEAERLRKEQELAANE